MNAPAAPSARRRSGRLTPADPGAVRAALRRPVLELDPGEALPGDGQARQAPVLDEARAYCPNCGAERAGNYCHACGQEYLGGRLTLWRFWHEFAERYLKLESGLWFTFRQMFVDPGGVARRYVDGQRRRYVNPLGYFLVAATVCLIAFVFVEDAMVEFMTEQNRATFAGHGEETTEVFTNFFGEDPARGMAESTVALLKRINTYTMLFVSVLFALALRLFFPGPKEGGRNLAETLVFTVFAVGHVILVAGLCNIVLERIGMMRLMILYLLGYVLYVGWAARSFYQKPDWKTSLLAMVAFGLGYAGFMVVVAIAAFVFGLVTALMDAGAL